jgi:hypothetical protein
MAKKPETKEASIPRMRMSELGTIGLATASGHVLEECKKDLRFPQSVKTFKEMGYDATISSAIGIYEMMMKRVEWDVVYPPGASEEQKQRALFIRQCMNDMEHSWKEFIGEITSYITYGFSVHEKVYRRRYKANGSKYNDGFVGWRKLPVRSQDTISKWVWSEDGRELIGVEQDPRAVEGGKLRYKALAPTGKIEIPRKKFLLFRCDSKRDNPEGTSLLRKCYFAWKFRSGIQEQEAIGVAR